MLYKLRIYSVPLLVALMTIHCTDKKVKDTVASNNEANPLVQKWEGPYNGVPPFDKIKVEYFKPALEAAMAENRQEINQLVSNAEAPTFKNTIEGLEKSGTTLKRVYALYSIWKNNLGSPQLDSIQEEMEPRLTAFNDSIIQNASLFKKIEMVYNDPAKKDLNAEQQRLLERYYKNFVLAGARLDAESKAQVAEINRKLAGLFTKFNKHQLSDEGEKFLELSSEKDLDGLPEDVKAAALAAAGSKNKKGACVISNTRSSVAPFITYSNRRDLREKAWRMFINRGDNGDANDNNAIITEILQLRAQRAALLGYPTHAHWRLADKMAKTPENAMKLLESVWTPAVMMLSPLKVPFAADNISET